MIRRRDFISLLGGAAAAWPLGLVAQPRRPLIGYLAGATSAVVMRSSTRLGLSAGLRELGYDEGRNIEIAHRFADGILDRLPALATQLVGLKPDVLFAPTTLTTLAARSATRSIPIVCPLLENPVRAGLVESENRPGGNVTGLLRHVDGLAGKYLELARELVPGMAKVGLLVNVRSADPRPRQDVESAAAKLSVGIAPVEVGAPNELDAAFATFAGEHVQALILLHDPLFFSERRRIMTLAAAARLPTIWTARELVEDGGVLSYGVNEADSFGRAAAYVVKILNGAQAGELPLELPVKFELVINLKTAKALGLDVPWFLQQRADEVIE
jgi:putative tryptophan/tyrosine transport system substrate-binding protein